jgi:8-oxo-dGTP pyrophosphatase MutT (NUDIX family)
MKSITAPEIKLSSWFLFFSGKRQLLLKRSPSCGNGDTWGVPGGQRRGSEASYAAAIREAEEELGTVPKHGVISALAIHRGARRYEVFACKTQKKIRRQWSPTLNHEHVGFRWARLEWCVRHVADLHPVLALIIEDSEGRRWLEQAFVAPQSGVFEGGRRATDFQGAEAVPNSDDRKA